MPYTLFKHIFKLRDSYVTYNTYVSAAMVDFKFIKNDEKKIKNSDLS